MDHSGEGVSVYAEAKGEYTKQMCQYLVPALHKYFLDLLEEAREKEPEAKKLLLKFQMLLEEITDWNMDKVQRETGTVIKASQCDYMEELLAAVFIAHTKVLSAIRLTTKQKKLQITIPKLDHFLHRTLTECARILWSNTYLFSPTAPSLERQRNLRQIETLLHDGVLQSIRSMLPVKNILREYLREEEGDDSDEEEETEETAAEEAEAAAAATEGGAAEAVASAEAAAAPTAETAAPTEAVAATEEAAAAPAPAERPTIVVDTTAPIVPPPFSGNDTSRPEELAELEEATTAIEEELEEDEDIPEHIEISEAPPEPLDDFEDLEKPAAAGAAAATASEEEELVMDFETLS